MQKIQYRIAVVGSIDHDTMDLYGKAAAHIQKLRELLKGCGVEPNQVVLLVPRTSLDSAGTVLEKLCHMEEVPVQPPQEYGADGASIGDSSARTLVQLSDLADLVLGFWDENPDGPEFYVWETLHRCMEKKVPCLWYSKKDGQVYWANRILFEPFQESRFQECLGMVRPEESLASAEPVRPWLSRMAAFGNRLYKKMLAKYASAPEQTDTCSDRMIEEGAVLADPAGEAARKCLLKEYQLHDTEALRLSEKYRGSVYWRSLLPMAATVLLAIGFYADAIGTIIWGKGCVPKFVYILMGLAFFAHALVVFSSHLLARNRGIQSWHTSFLYHRIIAEILRYYIHTTPYGITLPLNRLLRMSGFDTDADQPVYATIWQLLHSTGSEQPVYQEKNIPEYLQNMEAYLRSQLTYHRRNAVRLQALRNKLRRLETVLVSAGIAVVILRGFAQFFIIGVNNVGSRFALPGYVGSVANMIAMIVPAAGSYYGGKLTLLGFEDSITMSQLMEERLEKAIEIVQAMKGRNVNYSMVRNLTEQLGNLMMGDVAVWNREMAGRRIKGL